MLSDLVNREGEGDENTSISIYFVMEVMVMMVILPIS
jgi:hypothetical protein